MADKKLAKKLAKMSEEERTIFLEQQRLAEEESQKKKEEDLFGVLKVRSAIRPKLAQFVTYYEP